VGQSAVFCPFQNKEVAMKAMRHVIDYHRALQEGVEAEMLRSEGNADHVREILTAHVSVLAQFIVSIAEDRAQCESLMETTRNSLTMLGEMYMTIVESKMSQKETH
jgi:hypothetical protein